MERPKEFDVVERPKHYNSHPSGLEAIDICEHLTFNLGNAVKYLWRSGLKNDEVEDLKKALWYIKRERALEDIYEAEPDDSVLVTVRVLQRKVVAAAPETLLARLFSTTSLGAWQELVSEEIKRRQAK